MKHKTEKAITLTTLTSKVALCMASLAMIFSASIQTSHAKKNTTPEMTVQKQWQINGLQQPESAIAHTQSQRIYVSNMNGQPMEDNGKGYISKLSLTGEVIMQKWITGLGAPKGMAISGNLLYVADLQTLHVIDHVQGKLLQSIKVHDAKMLNDVTVDNVGTVYVSDLLAGGIYRLQNKHMEKWLSSDTFHHPNGLLVDGDHLVVATWGKGMQNDFSTKQLGSLYKVNLNTGVPTPLKGAKEIGNLDGLVKIGNRYVFNDWMNGNVFAYQNQKTTKLFNAGKNAADIGAWGNTLLVPMMFSERMDVYEVKEK